MIMYEERKEEQRRKKKEKKKKKKKKKKNPRFFFSPPSPAMNSIQEGTLITHPRENNIQFYSFTQKIIL